MEIASLLEGENLQYQLYLRYVIASPYHYIISK